MSSVIYFGGNKVYTYKQKMSVSISYSLIQKRTMRRNCLFNSVYVFTELLFIIGIFLNDRPNS